MEFKRLGKYEILAKIGEGAMGKVYKAHDPNLNREVAIKLMPVGAVGREREELRRRFYREAQSVARLNHSNIVTLYDFGEEQGVIYMAMELLEGNDLKELIFQRRPAALDARLALMAQICDGLAFAHAHGIVHRDLKPANIHVQDDGHVKVMDFGLARDATSDMTRTGVVLGTPHYMSPEQVRGERVRACSDVFSLGAVFYELLAWRKAFEAESLHGVLYQVMNGTPVSLELMGIPTTLCQIITKALSKDLDDRYADARELREALYAVRLHAPAGLSAGPGESQRSASGITTASLGAPDRSEDRTTSLPAAAPKSPPQARPPVQLQAQPPTPPPQPQAPPSAEPPVMPLTPPPTPPVARPATARQPRPSFRPASVPPPPVRRSAWMPAAGALLALAVLTTTALLVWPMRMRGGGRLAPEVPPEAKGSLGVDALAIQLEQAREHLQGRDYAAAARDAEQIVERNRGQPEAQRILDEAQGSLRAIEDAVGEARSALAGGENERASLALDRLRTLAPDHPAVAGIAGRLEAAGRRQAAQGRPPAALLTPPPRRSSPDPATSAVSAGTPSRPPLSVQLDDLVGRAETELQANRPEEALRLYEDALKLDPQNAGASAGRAKVVTARDLARRTFVTGATTVQTREAAKSLDGFEAGGVKLSKAARDSGQIAVEVAPEPPRPGQPFTVKLYLLNTGKKPFKVASLTAVTAANGVRSGGAVAPRADEIAPGGRSLVWQTSAAWKEGTTSWSLDALVTTPNGETFRAQTVWK